MFSSVFLATAADLALIGDFDHHHHHNPGKSISNNSATTDPNNFSTPSSDGFWARQSSDHQTSDYHQQIYHQSMEPPSSMIVDEGGQVVQQIAGPSPGCCDPDSNDSATMDDSFLEELEPRGRCYTWPQHQFAPQQQVVQQQQNLAYPSCSSSVSSSTSRFPSLNNMLAVPPQDPQHALSGSNNAFLTNATFITFGNDASYQQQQQQLVVPQQASAAPSKPKPKRVRRRTADATSVAGADPQQPQPSHKKPNPWGEESYSDLIARALGCAHDGRLKLNEIYQWFSDNIPYFAQRSAQEEAQGWKNSIRHNLSLHSRFMRIQNEGAGKSSWWVINPDAKPGRNPRRRANTMEAATKTAIDKKRRGARKRVEGMVQQKGIAAGGPCSSSMASVLSPNQQDLFPGDELGGDGMPSGPAGGPNFDTFRPRAQSTLSVTGAASRLSPTLESSGFEDFRFPSWMDEQNPTTTTTAIKQNNGPMPLNPQVTDLLDRTDQMRLEVEQQQKRMLNGGIKMEMGTTGTVPLPPVVPAPPMPPATSSSAGLLVPKTEVGLVSCAASEIKQEQQQLPPPPSYQELSTVRRPAQMQGNQLLRGHMKMACGAPNLSPSAMFNNNINPTTSNGPINMVTSSASMMVTTSQQPQQYSPASWMGGPPMPPLVGPPPLGQFMVPNSAGLPMDLENVNAMSVDQALLGELDMDAVLGHGGQFDLP